MTDPRPMGETLRLIRRALRIEQTVMGDILGVGRQGFLRWESSARPVPTWLARQLEPWAGAPEERIRADFPAALGSQIRGLHRIGLKAVAFRRLIAAFLPRLRD